MGGMTSAWKAFCVTSMTFALVSAAHAVTLRTFVSSVGNDSNAGSNCAEATPCATFAGAYAVTKAGGEIVALTSGSYGPITITGPLQLIGTHGASITGSANTTSITINAGASDKVIIRDIDIDGGNNANSTGIKVNSGIVVVIDCKLELLATGLSVSNTIADVVRTDFIGNTVAIATTGTGTDTFTSQPVWGPTQVRISQGNILDNTTAFVMNDPGKTASGGMQNKITVLAFQTGNFLTTNIAGNGTETSGTGTSCQSYDTPDPSTPGGEDVNFNCNQIYTYSDAINFQVPN